MAYRLPDKRRHLIVDRASESVIVVDNGTITRVSIPCMYSILRHPHRCHDRVAHDHAGWPSPDSLDDSCQIPDERRHHGHHGHHGKVMEVREIDLVGEGYESIEVALHEPPEGLTVTGEIDGSIVRITIVAMCSDASIENMDVPFSVYAIGSTTTDDDREIQLRDVITKGILRVVAGPIEED